MFWKASIKIRVQMWASRFLLVWQPVASPQLRVEPQDFQPRKKIGKLFHNFLSYQCCFIAIWEEFLTLLHWLPQCLLLLHKHHACCLNKSVIVLCTISLLSSLRLWSFQHSLSPTILNSNRATTWFRGYLSMLQMKLLIFLIWSHFSGSSMQIPSVSIVL